MSADLGILQSIVTATPGGGKSAGAQVFLGMNRVVTVASNGDSVKLPTCDVPNTVCIVDNRGSHTLQVYGSAFDTIDNISTNTGFAQAPGCVFMFVCQTAAIAEPSGNVGGNWTSAYLGGLSQTSGQVWTSNGAGNSPSWQNAGGGGDTFIKAYRTTDGATVHNTTLVADDVLKFAIGANEAWQIQGRLIVFCALSGNMWFGFTGPSSPSLIAIHGKQTTPGSGNLFTAAMDVYRTSDSVDYFMLDAFTPLHDPNVASDCTVLSSVTDYRYSSGFPWGAIDFDGVIVNGSNAGNVNLAWSPSDVHDTHLRPGSYLIAHKLA